MKITLARIQDRLLAFSEKQFIYCLMLVGFISTLPSLNIGFQFDDFYHRLILLNLVPTGLETSDASIWGLFTFLDGDPERTRLAIDQGIMPWWAQEEVKYAHWRPFAELTHFVDYLFWPNQPVLMHLQNSFCYALIIFLLAHFYRPYIQSKLLWALALLIFIFDSGHAIPVAWIANRNALWALIFSLLVLCLYQRYNSQGRILDYVLAMAALVLALLSSEMGVAVCAFLIAYALCVDDKGMFKGMMKILPFGLLTVVWIGLRSYLGFGAEASEVYTDPVTEPFVFLNAYIQQAPDLIFSQWFAYPAELLVKLSMGERLFCMLVLLLSFFLLLPLLKSRKNARFWLLAVFITAFPISASVPQGRLLLFMGIALTGLLIEGLNFYFAQGTFQPSNKYSNKFSKIALGAVLMIPLFAHLTVSPLLYFYGQGLIKKQMDPLLNMPTQSLSLPDDIEHKKLILLNPPIASVAGYTNIIRATQNLALAENTWILTSGLLGLTLERIADNALRITPAGGFLNLKEDRLVRSDDYPLALDSVVVLNGLTVSVRELNQRARPQTADFEFDQNLNSDIYVFMVFKGGRYQVLELPELGGVLKLGALSF